MNEKEGIATTTKWSDAKSSFFAIIALICASTFLAMTEAQASTSCPPIAITSPTTNPHAENALMANNATGQCTTISDKDIQNIQKQHNNAAYIQMHIEQKDVLWVLNTVTVNGKTNRVTSSQCQGDGCQPFPRGDYVVCKPQIGACDGSFTYKNADNTEVSVSYGVSKGSFSIDNVQIAGGAFATKPPPFTPGKLISWEKTGNEYFGLSVDINSDNAAVGEPSYTNDKHGIAYVISDPTGTSRSEQQVTPIQHPDVIAGTTNSFGHTVKLTDKYLIVASPTEVQAPQSNGLGALHIFEKEGQSWAPIERLSCPSGLCGKNVAFANYIAIGGEHLLADVSTHQKTKVVVYAKSATGWDQTQTLTGAAANDPDFLPTFVDFDGKTALIGNSEQIYIYELENEKLAFKQKLSTKLGFDAKYANAHQSGSPANTGVVSKDIIAIGKPDLDQGAVFLFKKDNGIWKPDTVLTAPDLDLDKHVPWEFGKSIDLNDNNLIVASGYAQLIRLVTSGTRTRRMWDGTKPGSVYSFKKAAGNWSNDKALLSSDLGADLVEMTSQPLAFDGTTILIGRLKEADGSEKNAYAFSKTKMKTP